MRKIFLFCLVFLTMFAIVACGSNSSTTTSENSNKASDELEVKDITLVGVRDAQISSQQIIADKLGFFKEEGLNVTNQLIESGPDIGPMIAGGSAPVSLQTNFMDIILASSGVKVKIVAPLAQIAGTQAVVAGKHAEINSPKDLEGKSIGIPSGADVMIAIQNMANDYNVDIKKINFVNLAPSDALTALEKGDIDAMAAWEPFITKAINSGGKLLFSGTVDNFDGKEKSVDWMSVHTTLQVTDDFLKENPNTVKAIIRALIKATDYINKNREEAIKILAPELHLEESELKEIMNRNVYTMQVDDSFMNKSNGSEVGEYLLSVGNIKNIPNKKDYIDFSLLEEVEPELMNNK
ncbi:NitT/TauT family transport system substrate-binding protein [Aeribacillus composti]|jgi:ABC-type nitrate/sulfonate/bicarbonate transport system substrate-binding protein|uniref:ABC transporter substrate-binding protein n=1 Tax=Aeribacillus TaxID=1055323 RepID=UPI00119BAC64|nr:ABC transporter substrate-binding protein [Aeribacillus composti]TVZ81226.1 NitT/TauT family transport system substrate-binding protein [Aeribacillus composti]